MPATSRSAVQPLLVAILVLISTVVLAVTAAVSAALSAAVALTVATTPLVVPGTGTKNPANSNNYMQNAVAYYVATSGTCGDGCGAPVPVPYISEFWPFPFPGWGGLEGAKWNVSVASGVASLDEQLDLADPNADNPVAIFGYSQGATVTSIMKSRLADEYGGTIPGWINLVVIGNPNRPNGGLFERLAALGTVPILDATFGQPTRTDTSDEVNTYDVALQYDGVTDAPSWLLNSLALANALAGFEYTHPTYLAPDGDDPITETPYGYTPQQVQAAIENAQASCTAETHCQQHGDTRYITLPARVLPIMQPFLDFGASTGTSALVIPVVDLVSPLAQTLIETGYDRTDYGRPHLSSWCRRSTRSSSSRTSPMTSRRESTRHATRASTRYRAGPTRCRPPTPPNPRRRSTVRQPSRRPRKPPRNPTASHWCGSARSPGRVRAWASPAMTAPPSLSAARPCGARWASRAIQSATSRSRL